MKTTLQKLIPVLEGYFEGKEPDDVSQFEIVQELNNYLWGNGLGDKINLPFDLFDLMHTGIDSNFWIEARVYLNRENNRGETIRGDFVFNSDVYLGSDTQEVLESLASLWTRAEEIKTYEIYRP